MSSFEHRASDCERGIDAGAYVLRALTPDESAAYAEHLQGCAHCAHEVEDLRLVVDTLPIAAPQVVPSPALKSRIMTVVHAESELLRAAGPEADRVPAPAARRRRWLPAFALRPAFAGALACALLALGVVGGLVVSGDDGPETRTLAAQASGSARAAKASLEVRGEQAALVLRDMPAPPKGQVYQVWLERAGGQLVASRTVFGVRSDGRAHVAIDEPVDGVKRILVTAEPTGNNLAPSSAPIIAAAPA